MSTNTLIDALLGHQPGSAAFLKRPDGSAMTYADLRAQVAEAQASLETGSWTKPAARRPRAMLPR